MKVTPEIETYFLAFSLTQEVRSNVPDAPDEVLRLRLEITNKMQNWKHEPVFLQKLRRAYEEVGTDNRSWFFGQLAEAYIQWLRTTRTKAKTE